VTREINENTSEHKAKQEGSETNDSIVLKDFPEFQARFSGETRTQTLTVMDTFTDPWQSPQVLDGLSSGDQMDSLAELQEGTFEPQVRARSNTWPLPRPENFVEPNDDAENNQQANNQQSLTGKSCADSGKLNRRDSDRRGKFCPTFCLHLRDPLRARVASDWPITQITERTMAR
jgi:hypothetical protein